MDRIKTLTREKENGMEKYLTPDDRFTTDARQLSELYSKMGDMKDGLQAARLEYLKVGQEAQYDEFDEKNDLVKDSMAAAEDLMRLAYKTLQQAQASVNHETWSQKWDGKRATARQVHELIWGNANITSRFV
jgi:hypothetical protein